MRKVEVVEHRKEWLKMFSEESERIRVIFGNELINIYHIGSTAIPGIKAKPIIDIMVEVINLDKVAAIVEEMEQIGYESMGELGINGRRFFMKGGDRRTYHVHVFEKGNPEITRHLAFRDYMNAHPEEAQEYSKLKEELAKKFSTDIEKYIEGKDGFIKDIDKKAGKWIKSLSHQRGKER